MSESVSVTDLRQHLQEFLARVNRGQRLEITSRGRVIAQLTPPASAEVYVEAARQRLRASVLRYDDPMIPAFDPGEWDMNR